MNKLLNGLAVVVIILSSISSVYVFASIDDNLRFTDTGKVIHK